MSKTRRQIASYLGILIGLWLVFMGTEHFPMAYDAVALPDYACLAPNAADFLVLLCLCIGILLIFVGLLSVFFAIRLRAGDKTARGFFLLGGTLFLARSVFEVLHPVSVPEPQPGVLVMLSITCLAFFVTAAISGRSKG